MGRLAVRGCRGVQSPQYDPSVCWGKRGRRRAHPKTSAVHRRSFNRWPKSVPGNQEATEDPNMRLIVHLMVLCVAFSGAVATARTPVNQRQVGQRNRVAAGVYSGSLTNWETAKLAAQQRGIQNREFRDRVDGGRFTTKERNRMQKRLNNASREIYQQKHDGRTR